MWPCILTCVFYWLPYWTASYLHKYDYDRSIKLFVTHHLFQSSLRKKETHMFYVDNITTLSVFSELLWKFTLLVRYKLNISRPPRANQFDISALLFVSYSRFIPLDKMVFYGYRKTLPSRILSMLNLAFTLFTLCNGLYCSLYNYYLNNSNSVLCYVCFYYCLSGQNYIISLNPNYRRKHLTRCHMTPVRKF